VHGDGEEQVMKILNDRQASRVEGLLRSQGEDWDDVVDVLSGRKTNAEPVPRTAQFAQAMEELHYSLKNLAENPMDSNQDYVLSKAKILIDIWNKSTGGDPCVTEPETRNVRCRCGHPRNCHDDRGVCGNNCDCTQFASVAKPESEPEPAPRPIDLCSICNEWLNVAHSQKSDGKLSHSGCYWKKEAERERNLVAALQTAAIQAGPAAPRPFTMSQLILLRSLVFSNTLYGGVLLGAIDMERTRVPNRTCSHAGCGHQESDHHHDKGCLARECITSGRCKSFFSSLDDDLPVPVPGRKIDSELMKTKEKLGKTEAELQLAHTEIKRLQRRTTTVNSINITLTLNELNLIQHLIISSGNAQAGEEGTLLTKVEQALDQMASVPVEVPAEISPHLATHQNAPAPRRAPYASLTEMTRFKKIDDHLAKLSGAMDQVMVQMKNLVKLEERINGASMSATEAISQARALGGVPKQVETLKKTYEQIADRWKENYDQLFASIEKLKEKTTFLDNNAVSKTTHADLATKHNTLLSKHESLESRFGQAVRGYDNQLHELRERLAKVDGMLLVRAPVTPLPLPANVPKPAPVAEMPLTQKRRMAIELLADLEKSAMLTVECLPRKLKHELGKLVQAHGTWVSGGVQEVFTQQAAEVMVTFKAMMP
jgi:hypothetical protein